MSKIHFISVTGKSAEALQLEQYQIPDFKALMRTVISGRVMVISTHFRTDILYSAEESNNKSIVKMWTLHADTNLVELNRKDFVTEVGDEQALFGYFQSINKLATHWHHYDVYQKAFQLTFSNDPENPVARMVVACDQHLVEHASIDRNPLNNADDLIESKVKNDTFALAMKIIEKGLRN